MQPPKVTFKKMGFPSATPAPYIPRTVKSLLASITRKSVRTRAERRAPSGVKLQFDLGTAGMQNDMDLRPNFTLNWLPPAGTAVTVKVRLRYIYKGEDFGNWSDWKTWTLASV